MDILKQKISDMEELEIRDIFFVDSFFLKKNPFFINLFLKPSINC
jgi:hypothetical protein